VAADNLRKGAALNAVQIAEVLVRDYLSTPGETLGKAESAKNPKDVV